MAENIRVNIPKKYDLVVGDLSFISLKMILVPAWNRVEEGGALVMLIKPQFEATREEVSKTSGIIKDSAIHERVVKDILAFAETELPGFSLLGLDVYDTDNTISL